MREELMEQIKTLAKTERFKQDSYFFCGSPSDAPNDGLLRACERYLEKAEARIKDSAAAAALIAELEAIAPAKPSGFQVDAKESSAAVIWNLLDHRDEL